MAGVIVVDVSGSGSGEGGVDGDGEDCDGVDEDGGRRDRTDQVGLEKIARRPESGSLVSSGAGGCDEPGDCSMLRRRHKMYDIGPDAVVVLKLKALSAPLPSTRLRCMVGIFVVSLFVCSFGLVDTAVLFSGK